MRKLVLKIAPLFLSLFAFIPLAQAGFSQYSIGLNFGSDNTRTGNSLLNSTDTLGLPAVAQQNWNNLPGATGSSSINGPIVDNSGATTTIGVDWNGGGTWSSGSTTFLPGTADAVMMNGYLDSGGIGSTTTVIVTNLPAALTSSGYDVYVYTLFDTANRGGNYTLVDPNNTATVLSGPLFMNSDGPTATNYVQYPQGATTRVGNYLVFRGLTNSSFQLNASPDHGGTPRTPIDGIQVVSAPSPGEAAPATGLTAVTNGLSGQLNIAWTNGAGASGALVVMRRGLPETAQPVDGTTYTASATFGNGTNLGDDEVGAGNYVVYSGTGSSVTVSNLTPTVTYFVAVYSFTGSGASINYTLASPQSASATPGGVVSSINLVVPTSVPQGASLRYSVTANYDNGTSADVTPQSTVTSSNTAIVSVSQAARKISARAIGTATLKAVFQSNTNTVDVTVVAPSLTHRYSFSEAAGTTNVTDSAGGTAGDGTVVNADGFSTMDGAGNVQLGGSGGYVALPANLFTNYGGITLEMWATDTSALPGQNWARYWDFGNGPTINMFCAPLAANAFLRAVITTNGTGGEQTVQTNSLPTGDQHQIVYTIDGSTRIARLYVDGVLAGINANVTDTPEDMGPTPNDWLGRSQYADPYFAGNINEFRTFNGPLNAVQIALDAANGPDTITTDPGTLTNVTLTAVTSMAQFAVEQATVLAYYSNLPNPVDISQSQIPVFSSSDSTVITVSTLGLVTANGPGTATLKAVVGNITNQVSITVAPLPIGMLHRWSFNGNFNDSINPATPAVPQNAAALDGSGHVVLDGSGAGATGSYVSLPANILLGIRSITLETWYTDELGDGTGVNRNWARLWDFGNFGGHNLFCTPFVAGRVDTMRFSENINNTGEWQVHILRPLTNVEHQLVFVIDASNHTASAYVDGELAGVNRNFRDTPTDLGQTANNYLGRSQYGDPIFAGSIDEFRIYNGTLDPVQIGIDYATGPNSVVTNPGALNSVSVVLTTNLVASHQEHAHAYANFASAANVPVTAALPTWTSSNPSVATVDQYGMVTAVGPGTATISATFQSVTGSADVIVSANNPVLTHRYSFNAGDARDDVSSGGGDGTPIGTAVFANGMLDIVDNNGWVTLPGHLFDTNLEVTLETWCVVSNTTGSGSRMVDFGTSINSNPSAVDATAFGFAPTADGNNYIAFRQSPNARIGVPSIDSPRRPAFNTTNHYAFVVSDINRRVDIYLNGVLKDSFGYDSRDDLGQLTGGTAQYRSMLGYQYTNMTEGGFGIQVGAAAGSGWRGSIDEFRIWSGAMNRLQAAVSYQKGPNNPSLDPGAIQTLSVTLSDPTMVLGAIQRPTVSATFANTTGNIDLTGFSQVVSTSDNSSVVAIVTVNGEAKLKAAGVGTAHVVTSYSGKSVTNTVDVVAKPQLMLTHRYSFSSDANDSVGTANGELFGHATISGGKLVLDGSSAPSTYVQLPSDLISGYDLATFEAFYSASPASSGTQQRLWDFGDHVHTPGGIMGAGYLYMAEGRGAVGMPNSLGAGSEVSAIAPATDRSAYTTNTTYVAVTVDSINHILTLYTNGQYAASVTNPIVDLSVLVNRASLLGRSQWLDPEYNGSIDEFRVYYGAMTPSQVAASFVAGPDMTGGGPQLNISVSGGSVIIAWPVSGSAGYSLQVSTSLSSPNWQPAGSPTVVGDNNQVTVPITGDAAFYRLIK